MKNTLKYTRLFSLVLLAAFMTACQPQGSQLDLKKAELSDLITQKREIESKIQTLELEIADLDTSTKKIKTVAVEVSPIETGDLNHYVRVQGKIDSDNNVSVMPKNPSGVVTAVYVDEGQRVARGKLLAKMDDAAIMSSVKVLEKQLELATKVFEKQKRLWDQKIGSEIQFLQAKNTKEALEQQIHATREQADMLKIYAPISGTVDKVHVKVGQGINVMTGAFQIVNLNDISFKSELSESYANKITRGDEVEIYFPTLDQKMNANVSVVGSSIHPTRRTFEIECKMPKGSSLKANMIGEININDESVEDAILLPVKYVRQTELGSYIYVAEQNEDQQWIAVKKIVKLGLQSEGVAHVVEGLNGSEQIITAGYQTLSDGQAIAFNEEVANN